MQRISTYYKRPIKNKKPKLDTSPQKKCVVMRLRICTPRKPNSARRPAAKIRLSNKKKALAHIPGTGLVNYTCIRGVFDFNAVTKIKKRRSIYGLKQDSSLKKHIRRKLRNLN